MANEYGASDTGSNTAAANALDTNWESAAIIPEGAGWTLTAGLAIFKWDVAECFQYCGEAP